MDLDIPEGAIRFGELVGVSGIAVHVTVRVRRSAIREEMHNLVDRLLVIGKIIPKHGGILKVRLRVALLGMYEEGEFGRVANEKNRGIVKNPIEIPVKNTIQLAVLTPENP